ncbi:MAG: MarR family transcriptional regulator [Bifidobacterium sp.]|jgi:DNA-binding MarR family transcriptional regulator|nr:MarR family transcriptional regulator [Bifidobacterium sp.]MCH4175260.1 MarR family transcriptional regulator [Bifidobacterium sp.]
MTFADDAYRDLIQYAAKKHSEMMERMSRDMKGEPFVLAQLGHHGTMTPSELAAGLGSSSARISAVLASLEKKGLITRDIDREDRRNILVSLTDEGRAQGQKRHEEMHSAICWIFEQMGERKTKQFIKLTKEFTIYTTLCEPGKPRPSAKEIEQAFHQSTRATVPKSI